MLRRAGNTVIDATLNWPNRCTGAAACQETPVGKHSVLKVVIVAALGLTCIPSSAAAQPPYPYGGVPYIAQSDLRIQMTPKEAAVYVDGYYAGVVEDFDGTFQRLHVEPGSHEIVVYLEGYRSRRERLYLGPNHTRKLTGTLEKLAPGEPSEPLPEPAGPPPPNVNAPDPQAPGVRRGAPPRGQSSGSIVIRVRPDDAEIVIDGEVWPGGLENGEFVVQLAAGRHQVEIRRSGFRTFVTEIDIRGGQTSPLNVNLTREN